VEKKWVVANRNVKRQVLLLWPVYHEDWTVSGVESFTNSCEAYCSSLHRNAVMRPSNAGLLAWYGQKGANE
jgi:hypothetical protein